MNTTRVKTAILAVAAFLVVIQFLQPARTNPPLVPSRALAARIQIPEPVQSILTRACGDCHSNQTVWPWYSHIAPVSWIVVDDVNEGRRHMNFQDWDTRAPRQASDPPLDICKEVRESGMPPASYRLMHEESRLSPAEISTLCTWFQSVAPELQRSPIAPQ